MDRVADRSMSPLARPPRFVVAAAMIRVPGKDADPIYGDTFGGGTIIDRHTPHAGALAFVRQRTTSSARRHAARAGRRNPPDRRRRPGIPCARRALHHQIAEIEIVGPRREQSRRDLTRLFSRPRSSRDRAWISSSRKPPNSALPNSGRLTARGVVRNPGDERLTRWRRLALRRRQAKPDAASMEIRRPLTVAAAVRECAKRNPRGRLH